MMWLRWFCNGLFDMFQEDYSSKWDGFLNTLIDSAEVVNFGKYTVTFRLGDDKYRVWVGNKFYSYGHLYDSTVFDGGGARFRPSYKTAKKLYELERRLHE